MEEKRYIIAIDGTSFVGKSTVAKALGKMLGYNYINTGYMFRAIAYKMLKRNIKEDETDKIIEIAKNTKIDFRIIGDDFRIIVDGVDISDKVCSPELVPLTSKISVISEVREFLLAIQRRIGKKGGIIFEGKDIGTKVFPNADWKFYLDAEDWKKAERMIKVMSDDEKKKYPNKDEVIRIIRECDERDKNREIAPLKKAEDAIYYDNTLSPTPEQDAIVLWYYITHGKEIVKNIGYLKALENAHNTI